MKKNLELIQLRLEENGQFRLADNFAPNHVYYGNQEIQNLLKQSWKPGFQKFQTFGGKVASNEHGDTIYEIHFNGKIPFELLNGDRLMVKCIHVILPAYAMNKNDSSKQFEEIIVTLTNTLVIGQNNRQNKIVNKMAQEKKQPDVRPKIEKNIIAFKASLFALALAGSGLILAKTIEYENQPIRMVTSDMMSNVGLNEFDAKKFGNDKTEELMQYIEQNELTEQDIYQSAIEFSKKNGISPQFTIEQLQARYPHFFTEPYKEQTVKGK